MSEQAPVVEPQRRYCDPCEGHALFEERTKLVDRIPSLLDFMAGVKGGVAVCVIVAMFIVSTAFLLISSAKSDAAERQLTHEDVIDSRMSRHEDLVKESVEAQRAQVKELVKITNKIEMNVTTFIETQKLMQKQAKEERHENKKKLERLFENLQRHDMRDTLPLG